MRLKSIENAHISDIIEDLATCNDVCDNNTFDSVKSHIARHNIILLNASITKKKNEVDHV